MLGESDDFVKSGRVRAEALRAEKSLLRGRTLRRKGHQLTADLSDSR